MITLCEEETKICSPWCIFSINRLIQFTCQSDLFMNRPTLVNSLLEEISVNDLIITLSYCLPFKDYRPQREQKSTSIVLLHPFWNLKDVFFYSLHAVHWNCKHNSSLFMKSYKFGTTVFQLHTTPLAMFIIKPHLEFRF